MKGIIKILKFFIKFVEINLIVVSDKITTIKPIKKITNLFFLYITFSFENNINDKDIRVNRGI